MMPAEETKIFTPGGEKSYEKNLEEEHERLNLILKTFLYV
jgi:hypothetical protein